MHIFLFVYVYLITHSLFTSFENENIANVEETTEKPKRVKMKRKLHTAMHDENVSFHRKRTRKSDEIKNFSTVDDDIMALAESAHENHR